MTPENKKPPVKRFKIGCLFPRISNHSRPLDFIEFFQKRSTSIFDIAAPLYQKGLSITDIAEQTGISRGSIWSSLKAHKQTLRPQNPVAFERWRQGHGKGSARPPFGFRYFQGEVIPDPIEYPILQLIQNLKKQGLSISSIVRKLDEKRIRTRTKKTWSYNVVKSILQRLDNGSIDHLFENKKPIKSKKKLFGGKK